MKVKCKTNFGGVADLSPSRFYDVIREIDNKYVIKNDSGGEFCYDKEMFESGEEFYDIENHLKNLKFLRRIEESSSATDRDRNVASLNYVINLLEEKIK